jgi:hypothetical protein
MCGHTNPMKLRLMTYTPYGAMVGCLSCGTSWLVSVHQDTPTPATSHRGAQ